MTEFDKYLQDKDKEVKKRIAKDRLMDIGTYVFAILSIICVVVIFALVLLTGIIGHF